MRGDFTIFSAKRSFLLRKRIMDVSSKNRLLQIESKSFILSIMRFWMEKGRERGREGGREGGRGKESLIKGLKCHKGKGGANYIIDVHVYQAAQYR